MGRWSVIVCGSGHLVGESQPPFHVPGWILLLCVLAFLSCSYERHLVQERQALHDKQLHQAQVQHELEKRDKRAQQLEHRAQQKAHVQAAKVSIGNSNNNKTLLASSRIQQPDKAKKLI